MIPNILHFNFGMKKDFGGKPFSLIHFLAIKSAIVINKPEKIYFWYQYEPTGYWWDKIKDYLTLKKINSPTHIFNKKLIHQAHKSDVVRLDVLNKFGGIYLDCDVISIKSFSPLLDNKFVMAREFDYGLCNAVMLSQSNSKFGLRWYDEYKSFRSKGFDNYWNEHSVKLPGKLSIELPDEITILPMNAFFIPSWYDIPTFITKDLNYTKDSYVVHLWEQVCWDYYKDLTINSILDSNSEFSRLTREYL